MINHVVHRIRETSIYVIFQMPQISSIWRTWDVSFSIQHVDILENIDLVPQLWISLRCIKEINSYSNSYFEYIYRPFVFSTLLVYKGENLLMRPQAVSSRLEVWPEYDIHFITGLRLIHHVRPWSFTHHWGYQVLCL